MLPFEKGLDCKVIDSQLDYIVENPVNKTDTSESATVIDSSNNLYILKLIICTDSHNINKETKDRFELLHDFPRNNNVAEMKCLRLSERMFSLITPFYNKTLASIDVVQYLDGEDASNVLIDIANGLESLHSQKIIHGNLKPTNILFYEDYNVLITDYSQYLINNDYHIINYMSPEMLTESEIDESTDIWSFGCILYYVLEGKSCFNNKDTTSLIRNIKSVTFIPMSPAHQQESNFLLKLLCFIPSERLKIDEIVKELNIMKSRVFLPPSTASPVSPSVNDNNNNNIPLPYGGRELPPNITPAPEIGRMTVKSFSISNNDDNNSVYIDNSVDIDNVNVEVIDNNICNNNAVNVINNNEDENVASGISIDEIKKKIDVGEKFNLELYKKIYKDKNLVKLIIYEANHINSGCIFFINKKKQLSYMELLLSILYENIKLKEQYISDLHMNDDYYSLVTVMDNNYSLDVRYGEVESKEIISMSRYFHLIPQTLSLNLTGINIGTSGIKSLSQYITLFTNLKCLKISNNKIGNKGMECLSQVLSSFSKLEELSLGMNNLKDDGFLYLAQSFSSLNNLKSLFLGGNNCSGKGIRFIAFHCSYLTSLDILRLGSCNLDDDNIRPLCEKWKGMNGLSELDLCGNSLKLSGISLIADNGVDLMYLKVLNLRSVNMGDEGVIYFSLHFKNFISLESLNAAENDISNKGAESVFSHLEELSSLKIIILDLNNITSDIVQCVVENGFKWKTIERISLKSTSVDAIACMHLREAFANVAITF